MSLVHYVDDRGAWASRGRSVLFSASGTGNWREIARFPHGGGRDRVAIGRLARRVLRTEKCSIYPTHTGKLLGIRNGGVYDLTCADGASTDRYGTPLFRIHGNCVMPRAIAVDVYGRLYFGEYFANRDRGPVRIWRVDPDLRSHEVAFEFPAGKTRHVHAVHADPFVAGRMWVTTGDFAGECHLVYSDDYFETVHFLGDGSQLWRMVGVIFQADRIFWLTDTHIDQNHVVSMNRERCEAVIVAERDASSWYAAETTDGMYLATTTVEPGPGIKTDKVRLLCSKDGEQWETAAEFQKDGFPMTAFGFGSVSLPAGRFDSSSIWLSGEGLRGLDGASVLGRLIESAPGTP